MARVKKHKKEEFDWILDLCNRQKTMLQDGDEALSQLYKICDDDIQKNLIRDLITRFDCFNEDIYNLALRGIARHIVSLGYPPEQTAIVAFAHNHEADSSQAMLQSLKVVLEMEGFIHPITINRFDRIQRAYNQQNIRHFIAIDEFIGSGQTVLNRNKSFQDLHLPYATIDFCVMAGMDEAINSTRDKGVCLYVEYSMRKGISDYYEGADLVKYAEAMEKLEDKLASVINMAKLTDYHFGYGHAESLFTTLHGNVPNNVFPIFWWKEGSNQKKRITLFTRVQDGY